jgi:hypothetical protein
MLMTISGRRSGSKIESFNGGLAVGSDPGAAGGGGPHRGMSIEIEYIDNFKETS